MSPVKRFYGRAEAREEDGAWRVTLDGRAARTPGRAPLSASRPLAEAMAAEWEAQGDTLDRHAMPLTALQSQMLDANEAEREAWRRTVHSYAGTDLLCYRADDPALAEKQAAAWQPYLDRVGEAAGGRFAVTDAILAVPQDASLMDGMARLVSDLAPGELLAVRVLTEISGSAVLALSVARGDDPAAAFAASRLDETHQEERWGTDEEAAARAAGLARDFSVAARYLALSRG